MHMYLWLNTNIFACEQKLGLLIKSQNIWAGWGGCWGGDATERTSWKDFWIWKDLRDVNLSLFLLIWKAATKAVFLVCLPSRLSPHRSLKAQEEVGFKAERHPLSLSLLHAHSLHLSLSFPVQACFFLPPPPEPLSRSFLNAFSSVDNESGEGGENERKRGSPWGRGSWLKVLNKWRELEAKLSCQGRKLMEQTLSEQAHTI